MRVVLALAVVLPMAAGAQEPAVPAYVEESATSGLVHSYTGGWEQMVGGGAAVFDCDDDGYSDLYLAGGTAPSQLFRNQSDRGGPLRFAAEQSGAEATGVSGAYPLDIDSDGITDLVVLRVGENQVMRGVGNCRFEPANADWGFEGGDAWSTAFAATWEPGADWPTLAIGNYIDRAQEGFPWGSCTDNWLHRGAAAGFAPPVPLKPSLCALSMLFTDWNRSGHPSLRVSNDREYYKGGQEQLWHLEPGAVPQLYTEAEGWARLRIWGMGIASADIDRNGYPDYYLTSMADQKFQVLADAKPGTAPKFKDTAFPRGIHAQRPYVGDDLNPSTGWHAAFGDVNNDGLADLFVAKGNVDQMPDFAAKDPDNLLLQRNDGTFYEAGALSGTGSLRSGRGGALADFNLDGLLDLLVVNRNDPVQVWRNGGTDAGSAKGHWLALRLGQPGTNRDAIGAFVEVQRGEAVEAIEVTSGGGHGSGQMGWLHLGLGGATGATLRVVWPDGDTTPWMKLDADRFWRLNRGQTVAEWHAPR
jgi:enediyne biosynthesis protein E4